MRRELIEDTECPECGELNRLDRLFVSRKCVMCEAFVFRPATAGVRTRDVYDPAILTERHWRYGEETIEEEII